MSTQEGERIQVTEAQAASLERAKAVEPFRDLYMSLNSIYRVVEDALQALNKIESRFQQICIDEAAVTSKYDNLRNETQKLLEQHASMDRYLRTMYPHLEYSYEYREVFCSNESSIPQDSRENAVVKEG